MGLLVTIFHLNLKRAQIIFFIPKTPSLITGWECYSCSCREHFRGSVQRLLQWRKVGECNSKQGRWVYQLEGPQKWNGEIHIDVQLLIKYMEYKDCVETASHWRPLNCGQDDCRLWWTSMTSSRVQCTFQGVEGNTYGLERTFGGIAVIKIPVFGKTHD